jgi:eukaryotic-like serine/threonine-protein kinase
MIASIKKLFQSDPAHAREAKVNLDRRFTILAETGQGSMSKVYKALDETTGRTVCLKVQIPDKNLAAAARTHEHKPDEGAIATMIVHPNVVRTLDFGVSTRGEQFLVMEFIDGESFRAVRELRSAPKLPDKLELLAQAADGLAACHAAGVIHHDVNPGNFLVDRDRTVKLIDFGLAVPNTPAFRRPGNRTGMLNYMAPELVRREPIDERIDVFAFGALAFELLTDRLPYDATTSMAAMMARINSDPLDPAKANPTLPAPLHDLMRKLIARRRDDRWPRMDTAAATLRSIAAGKVRAAV